MAVARWLVLAWVVAGCSLLAGTVPGTPVPPHPCAEEFGTHRCLAMTDEAASRSGRTRDDVKVVEIIPAPRPEAGTTLGGSASINVRLTFADGSTYDARMCGGLPRGPACTNDPVLEARTSVGDGGGYHDVPCPDPPPADGCGTPLPTLEPAAVKGAHSLSIAATKIPIDHLGPYEVVLGEAALPNGVVTSASFEFVDEWPLDVSLRDGVAQLNLRSLEPDGKPFQNYYDHGWRPGVERVEAVLAFEVLWFEPGAKLAIRDVTVH